MDIVLPGGDGELLSQGGVQLLGGRSSSKVVLAWIKEQIPIHVLWLALPAIQKLRQYNSYLTHRVRLLIIQLTRKVRIRVV